MLKGILEPKPNPASLTVTIIDSAEGEMNQSAHNIFCLPHRGLDMPTTVAVPDTDEPCVYCESRIFTHDPICVRDCEADCGSPVYFCNYACLSAYIDENNLTTGNACEWHPDDSSCC